MFLLQRDRIMLFLSLEAIKACRIHITPHIPNMPLVKGEWSASRHISENMTKKIKLSSHITSSNQYT
jgi:hypothetical protein